MEPSVIALHSGFQIGPVDPRIFGGFIEHLGRAVYQGVYDPDSIHADSDGFRTDVLDALRPLGMTVMRYPGGNFASGYHWENGVGPMERRPTVRDLAWQSVEPNEFGTDEFMALCSRMGWAPMLTVNLGTGTPEEARNWVEYCNTTPPATQYAALRAENGNPEPFGVKLWCLGNEMDGEWQLGHVPAEVYAIRAQQAAKMMKDAAPGIELVVCGSCGLGLPTYMEWDRRVLEYVGPYADYISLHRYVGNEEGDTADFLAVTNSIDRQIEDMDAACRFIQARTRSPKRAWLCFDEWNVWYRNRNGNGEGRFAPPLLEEDYNLEDALVVAGFLHSFLRHANVVRIANIAQIVNVIAPIRTRGNDLLIQSIYYPFQMFSARREGVALKPALQGPLYQSRSWGVVPFVDVSAVLAPGRVHVFVTNRHITERAEVGVDPADFQIVRLEKAEILTGPDPKAGNTFDVPDRITAKDFRDVGIRKGRARFQLPPLSLGAFTFAIE